MSPRRSGFASSASLALFVALAACGGGTDKPSQDPSDALGQDPAARPRSPEVARAVKALEEGRYEDARALLAAAVQKNDKDLDANLYLAAAYERLNDRKAAETYYRKTLELAPGHKDASTNLSAILLEDKRADEALAVCRDALKLSADSDKLHFNMARALADKGDQEGATSEFEKAIAISADVPDYHLAYGQWLGAWGKRDKGLEHVRQALVSARDDIEMMELVGRGFRLLRAADDCVSTFDRVLAKKDTAHAHLERGLCKMALKDGEKAETDLRAAIGLDAKSAQAHYWLGVLLLAKKDTKSAIAEFDAVLQLEPAGELAQKAAGAKEAALRRH